MEILHLEDSAMDAELIRHVLRREWPDSVIRHAVNATEYRAALAEGCFDVILSDYSMPGYDGLLALAEAKKSCPSTPFVFLSGMIGEERAVEALKRGATDYIIKDRPARLVPAIRQALALVTETTRRRESEEALRANDERFRLITENIADLIAVLELDGRRVYCNAACRKLLGDHVVERGTNWFQWLDPQDIVRVRCTLDRIVSTGAGERFDFRYRLPDGTPRYMEAHGAVLRNAAGHVANLLIISRDVTERRAADLRLREQASLLDKARDAIFATGLDRKITYWNASAERLYGLKAADVIGRPLAEIGLQYEAGALDTAHEAVTTRGEWRGELRIFTRNGTAVLVESTWSLVVENGHPRSILAIDTDVTERRKLEAQLLRAQRLESIGTLAGGIAHDLNNVFTPVLLALDLLGPLATSREECEVVEKTRASVTHGAALVRQLLAFARGSDGERTLVAPDAAVAAAEPLIRQWLPRTIELRVRQGGQPWPIQANVTQLNQALVNLALNARDAMPQGGCLEIAIDNVQVSAAQAAANPGTTPGPFVCLRVSDTGCGMPPELLERIFDPFFTTKAPGKGTGLGLSMLAGILRSHGGFVQVESTPGCGTTFHLHFPASAPRPAVQLPRPTERKRAAGKGVLLVDDEPAVRDALRALLQREGYSVFPAEDVSSALREFERNRERVSLVITDMMLPDGSGVEVIRSLRELDPSLPVIAISGMMASGRFDELLTLDPPVECLSKPLVPRVLLSASERALHVTT
jgi:PAS domain S-box-containing protein